MDKLNSTCTLYTLYNPAEVCTPAAASSACSVCAARASLSAASRVALAAASAADTTSVIFATTAGAAVTEGVSPNSLATRARLDAFPAASETVLAAAKVSNTAVY
jgi:hypothetical protein